MVKPTKPVDVYVRVSRVGGREHLMSPEEQERDARNFASSHGLAVGKVLTDLDKSGGTLARPGLQEALERVERKVSGGIVVAYLSRASRDTRQGLDLLDAITRTGGVVFAPNLPDYTTADGKMQTTIQLAIDAGYRERKGEEFERAKENAINNGIPVHTRPAVGYRARADRRLEPDPHVAALVRQVFERRAAGEGPAVLGRFLEANGVTTSQGSATWSKQAVYGLLSNRVYLGELSYGDPPRYVNPAAHEPIVDLATFQAAQSPNGRLAPPRSEGGGYLLAGLLRCSACRYCLQGTVTSRGKRIYRCTRTHAGGVCSAPARIDATTIEEKAVAAFWKLTRDLEAEGTKDTAGDLAELEADLARAETRFRQSLSPEIQEASGGGPEWAAMVREAREARDVAADLLGRARAAARSEAVPDTETLRSAWERMSTQERRELLGLRFHVLALHHDHRLVVYPAGTFNGELPRRGFKTAPELVPFPKPPRGTRTLRL